MHIKLICMFIFRQLRLPTPCVAVGGLFYFTTPPKYSSGKLNFHYCPCSTCHMASTFMPHSRTATTTICSTSSLLLLGFTLSRSFNFYCCKRLLGRNNTATVSAPHERCQRLLWGALLLSSSVMKLRLF